MRFILIVYSYLLTTSWWDLEVTLFLAEWNTGAPRYSNDWAKTRDLHVFQVLKVWKKVRDRLPMWFYHRVASTVFITGSSLTPIPTGNRPSCVTRKRIRARLDPGFHAANFSSRFSSASRLTDVAKEGLLVVYLSLWSHISPLHNLFSSSFITSSPLPLAADAFLIRPGCRWPGWGVVNITADIKTRWRAFLDPSRRTPVASKSS